MHFEEITSIGNFTTLTLIKSLFEAQNIKFILWGEQMMNADTMSGGGAARLFVAEMDVEQAKEILKNMTIEKKTYLF